MDLVARGNRGCGKSVYIVVKSAGFSKFPAILPTIFLVSAFSAVSFVIAGQPKRQRISKKSRMLLQRNKLSLIASNCKSSRSFWSSTDNSNC